MRRYQANDPRINSGGFLRLNGYRIDSDARKESRKGKVLGQGNGQGQRQRIRDKAKVTSP